MHVHAPADQLGDERKGVEVGTAGDGVGGRIHGDGIDLGGPGTVHLAHHPGLARAARRPDFKLAAVDAALARGLQHPVKAHRHVVRRRRHGGVVMLAAMMMGMLAALGDGCHGGHPGVGQFQRHRWRDPPQLRAQLVHARTGPVGPGQPGGREEHQADADPQPQQSMPAPGAQARAAGFQRLVAPAPCKPQHQTAQRRNPQPRRRQFAVVAAQVAQHQVAVQVVQLGPERQRAAGAVDDHVALDLQRGGVHKQRTGFGIAHAGLGKHHARGFAGPRRGPDGEQARTRSDLALRCLNLRREGLRRATGSGAQLVCVDEVFQLRGQYEQRAGHRRDQDEGADEQPYIEMQPGDQREQRAAACRPRPRGGGRTNQGLSGHDDLENNGRRLQQAAIVRLARTATDVIR